MKILLSSDWHLGKSLYHQRLLQHQEKFFLEEFIPLLRDLRPDLLIVAGDIFDRPIPDRESLFLFEEILRELASSKIRSLFILGNHDSRRTALHKFFLELGGIYIIDDLRFFLRPLFVSDDRGTGLYVYPLPYLSPYELEEILTQEGLASEGLPKVFTGEFLSHLMTNLTVRRPALFVGHFALTGSVFSGEELNIRGLSQDYLVDEALFEDFDFLFLGHLHRFQTRKNKIFYPGAPLPYSFESAGDKRGVLLFEITGNEIRYVELIQLTSPYELLILEDTFSKILSFPKTNAYLKIILTDKEPIYEAFHRLRERFPNLLYLDYKKVVDLSNEESTSFEWDDVNFESLELKIDELKLFKEFYRYVTKKDPDERIVGVFKEHLENFYKISNL